MKGNLREDSPRSMRDKGDSDNGDSEPHSSSEGINSGRWTKEEHDMFLEGLETYGKEWKKIADMIKTRTVVQIRTHAQKYFQKVAKTTGGPVMSTSKKEVIVRPPNRKRRSGKEYDGHDPASMNKPGTIQVPSSFNTRRTRSSDREKKEAGGATPRTIAAATILLRPRIQTKLQDGGATPKTRESAAWLAAHQDLVDQTLGKRRRSAHHSPRIPEFSESKLSWDMVAAVAHK